MSVDLKANEKFQLLDVGAGNYEGFFRKSYSHADPSFVFFVDSFDYVILGSNYFIKRFRFFPLFFMAEILSFFFH